MTQVQFPELTLGSSHLPVTLIPGVLEPYLFYMMHVIYICAGTYLHKQNKFKNKYIFIKVRIKKTLPNGRHRLVFLVPNVKLQLLI